MPLLFSSPIHNALAEVREGMLPNELLFAFLDDVYVVSNPDRTRPLYDLLGEKLAHAGIRLHAGKTRMWNKAARPTSTIWETRFGTQKGSRYWGPQWVQTCSCCEQRHPVWRRRADCGRPCHGSPTPSVPGRFSFNAPAPGVTTSSEQCPPGSRPVTRRAMMMACGGPWKGYSGDSPVASGSRRWLVG